MLSIAALILIVTSNVVLGQDDRHPDVGQIYPLDMAPDSVDDMYKGCTEKMEKLVKTTFLKQEICNNTAQFGAAWINNTGQFPESKKLKMHHLIAISVYTGDEIPIYKEFNPSVRSGIQKYQNRTYKWYSLQFLLTEAIKILKETKPGCMITYRGTNHIYNEDVLNTEIRFGSFASSSINKSVAMEFGTQSCFKIKTCYGANVTKYSDYPGETEVLIPPYEKFRVIKIKKRGQKGAWCNTVFKLESSGTQSNLNCKIASVKPNKYHNMVNIKYLNYL
ncbi:NAD(P)(+)--arginine ADP-ribosyltransferase 2-like [Paramisgurnus dabryanus]|uniref:NAD(P)(+)--arginine ADP-ribosyltransferase 2-like n=1 Tax=Paramisgurnus dabryanus TaxID=90735 RepID=UPI0031F43657